MFSIDRSDRIKVSAHPLSQSSAPWTETSSYAAGPPVTTGLIRFCIHLPTAGLIKSVFNWIRSSRDGALPPAFNPRSSVK